MATDYPVRIKVTSGAVTITALDGTVRSVPNQDDLTAGEVLKAGTNSSCVAKGGGFVLARISKKKAKGPTSIVSLHPLARRAIGSHTVLKATATKIGQLLILQAQREAAGQIRAYNLMVDLKP